MKSLIFTLITASALAVPGLSFAQQSLAPLTRAQVRAELGELEAAGFKGASPGPFYPANLHAAQARIAEKHASQAETSNYGPSAAGSSQSGKPGISTEAQ